METKVFDSWIAKINSGEGFTSDLLGNEPKSGFALAIDRSFETKLPLANLQDKIDTILTTYITKHLKQLINGAYLGVWINKDTLYLDLSEVERDFLTAMIKAKERKQLAFYDLQQGKDIPVLSYSNSGKTKFAPKTGQAELKSQLNIEGE